MEKVREKKKDQLTHWDFRKFLQSELLHRCQKNPHYSLRAFAKTLNIDHSTLSQILRGKRPISEKMLISLATFLSLGPLEIDHFKRNLKSSSSEHQIRDLSIDSFMIISEWYHDAILELMRIDGFRNDSKWIAKQLGITVSQVNIAVERLLRLELIEVNEAGEWNSHADRTEIGIDTQFTNSALRKYQKQILAMGIEALENISRESRHNISSTVAIDIADLPKAKKLMNEFRRKFSRFLQRETVKPNQIYQLGICFYPLTRKEMRNESV